MSLISMSMIITSQLTPLACEPNMCFVVWLLSQSDAAAFRSTSLLPWQGPKACTRSPRIPRVEKKKKKKKNWKINSGQLFQDAVGGYFLQMLHHGGPHLDFLPLPLKMNINHHMTILPINTYFIKHATIIPSTLCTC